MHEPYDDEDDGYEDDEYNNDYPNNPYQWYYKFDIGPNTPISNWLSDMINKWINPEFTESNNNYKIFNIPGFPVFSIPVNGYIPDTDGGTKNPPLYLGNNYQNQPIWKKKYFIKDALNTDYKNHISSHAQHFIQQPVYYKGLFDILN